MVILKKMYWLAIPLFTLIFLMAKPLPSNAALRCSDYTTPTTCSANCSPVKSNGNRYKCKWSYSQQSCKESSTLCGSTGGGGPVNLGDCPATIVNNCVRLDNGLRSNASRFFCPNMTTGNLSSAGCSLNEKRLVNANEVCFQRTCGTEQIDFDNVNGTKCFESRVSDNACGSVTSTPTPTTTSTPTPTTTTTPIPLICQQMKVFLNGVNITSNLGIIKYGDTVTYRAFANKSGQAVKSFTFQLYINGVVAEKSVIPATLSNGIWTADYKKTINKYGTHRVRVAAVTPQ